jgi:hypothetical protein
LSPLLNVLISSTTKSIPYGVLKSAVGRPWRTTLCQGSSSWALLKGRRCSQIDCWSRRNCAEKGLVVVTMMFWLRDFETVVTTGPWTPLAAKAWLKEFLRASGEKSWLMAVGDLMRMSLSDLAGLIFTGGAGFGLLGFFPTRVHSWGCADPGALMAAVVANDGGWTVGVMACVAVKVLALFSIFLVADSRLATWEAMMVEAFWWSFPFSVYSLNISNRSRRQDFSVWDWVREQASRIKSLASRILVLARECWVFMVVLFRG